MAWASRSASERIRVVVLGYLVRGPIGGMAWHHLQYAMGLLAMGHNVYFLEDSGDDPWACYDPVRGVCDGDPGYGLSFARQVFTRAGLSDRWAYHDALKSQWHGPASGSILEVCRSAEIVLNLSGENLLRPWVADIPVRVYVDTDPAFTQVRHLSHPDRANRASRHTAFFSFGENVACDGHAIPDDGFPWQPTRQPVVLDAWPVSPGIPDGKFTTVMQWDNTLQGVPKDYQGRRFGRKAESFASYIDLPKRATGPFELAVGGSDVPRALMRDRGWDLADPLQVSRDPWTYQSYIQKSKAEFSVAKQGYVSSRGGWFSERSAAYLASGRPVVVQQTGFSDWLKADRGVLAFNTLDEAVAAVEDISARYEFHCQAAREVAAEYFDARSVLARLLDSAGRSQMGRDKEAAEVPTSCEPHGR